MYCPGGKKAGGADVMYRATFGEREERGRGCCTALQCAAADTQVRTVHARIAAIRDVFRSLEKVEEKSQWIL